MILCCRHCQWHGFFVQGCGHVISLPANAEQLWQAETTAPYCPALLLLWCCLWLLPLALPADVVVLLNRNLEYCSFHS